MNILSLNWGQLDPVLNLETKWGQIRGKIRDKLETTFLLEQTRDNQWPVPIRRDSPCLVSVLTLSLKVRTCLDMCSNNVVLTS